MLHTPVMIVIFILATCIIVCNEKQYLIHYITQISYIHTQYL